MQLGSFRRQRLWTIWFGVVRRLHAVRCLLNSQLQAFAAFKPSSRTIPALGPNPRAQLQLRTCKKWCVHKIVGDHEYYSFGRDVHSYTTLYYKTEQRGKERTPEKMSGEARQRVHSNKSRVKSVQTSEQRQNKKSLDGAFVWYTGSSTGTRVSLAASMH